jgi:hypothetical protein
MNKNITDQLKLALSQSSYWNREKFIKYFDTIKNSFPNGNKDWDEYAGEKWGSILVDNKVVAYVSREFPLVFLKTEIANVAESLQDIIIIYFSDNNTDEYSIESNFFQQWSQGRSNIGDLDAQNLSVNDIWWATIL